MAEESRLWARKMRGQRILASDTEPCDPADPQAALQEICRRMDVQRPMWLGKHQKEYDSFRRTVFTPEHFIEAVGFSRLEIELILPEEQRKKAPRNPYTDA